MCNPLSSRRAWTPTAYGQMENFEDLNHATTIWKILSMNTLLNSILFEVYNLAKMVVVQIMGSVEDKRVFSILSFMKTKVRNKWTNHLDLMVCMFCQNYWHLDNFLFDDVFDAWNQVKDMLHHAISWGIFHCHLVMIVYSSFDSFDLCEWILMCLCMYGNCNSK